MSAVAETAAPQRPVLRWHGGKFRMAPWIRQFFPEHRIYVEPFCGAASVLLQKPRAWSEYLNDLDGELVNLFRVLQDEDAASRLIHLLRVTPFARQEFELAYGPAGDPVERARRLCILSFMGFSSGSATGRKTGFRSRSFRSNTGPAMDWRNYPENLWDVVDRLRGVTVESRPGLQVIASLDTPESLFYVDPPYPASTRTNFGAYRHEMSDAEHEELAAGLQACAGYVVISGYRCPLYDRLYDGWKRVEKRSMSDHGWRTECLWLSSRTARALDEKERQFPLLEA